MKKFFSLISMFVLSLFVFAGCGIEGGTEVTGIEFVRDVFYVDYNVSTFLDYKVYPATAEGVYVSYELNDDWTLESYYNFSKGAIKVLNKNFTSIIVKAKSNGYEDSCEVRLREYPTSVRFDKSSEILDSGMVYTLDLLGTFASTGTERSVEDGEFIYKVTSSDATVVDIVSEEGLIVQSTGRRGSVTITVQIYNSAGEKMNGLSASIDLVVSESIDSAYATFGNKFVITNGLEMAVGLERGSEYKIKVRYFDVDGFLVNLAECECYLSNDSVFEIVNGADGLVLKVVSDNMSEEPVDVVITLKSSRLMASGEPMFIQCKLQVQFL